MKKSENYYKKSLEIFKNLNDKNGLAVVYHNLALLYGENGFDEKAKQYFQKSVKLADDSLLGAIYLSWGNF
jgi:tetratricopeptide (TPR) repeat protein